MTEWPFADPPNTAVIVQKSVLSGAEWIGFVAHDDEDGGWQFMGNQPGDINQDDAAVAGLEEVFSLDNSIAELADLPLGWRASRPARGAAWQRVPSE